MVNCKFCGSMNVKLIRTWKMGKGVRKTKMAVYHCKQCFKRFKVSLGSVIDEKENTTDTEEGI